MKGGTRTKSAISAIGILALSALFSIDALTCTRLPMIRSLPSTQLAITTSEQQQQQQHEFELKVGKALDTLRTDYPDMLTKSPGMLSFSFLFHSLSFSLSLSHTLSRYTHDSTHSLSLSHTHTHTHFIQTTLFTAIT